MCRVRAKREINAFLVLQRFHFSLIKMARCKLYAVQKNMNDVHFTGVCASVAISESDV